MIGDEIILQSANSDSFVYTVTGKAEVKPNDVSLLTPTNYGSLALTTCTPKFYALRRLNNFCKLHGINYLTWILATTITGTCNPVLLVAGLFTGSISIN